MNREITVVYLVSIVNVFTSYEDEGLKRAVPNSLILTLLVQRMNGTLIDAMGLEGIG